jgi:mersacidin/lichenicidin family type 2 lantibiotic
MSHENIIRAWKDADFRNGLSEEQRSLLPDHPAGIIELADVHLTEVAGGQKFTRAGDEACYSGIIACTLPFNCPVVQ